VVIKVTSNAFNEGEHIPDKYACRGVNISPPIEWDDVDGTVKYELFVRIPMLHLVHGHIGLFLTYPLRQQVYQNGSWNVKKMIMAQNRDLTTLAPLVIEAHARLEELIDIISKYTLLTRKFKCQPRFPNPNF